MVRAVRYRVGQFVAALGAARHPPDTAPAEQVLPPDLREVFAAMPPADQRHGMNVFAALSEAGQTDPVLGQAALLHDCGKACAGVRVHHRVARVLLASGLPPLWRWLTARPTGWRRPYWVVANHPERGAVWVSSRGGSEDLVALIRYHEVPAPSAWDGTAQARRHAALAAVDARL